MIPREFDNSEEGIEDTLAQLMLDRLRTGATVIVCHFPENTIELYLNGQLVGSPYTEPTPEPDPQWLGIRELWLYPSQYPVEVRHISEERAGVGCLWAEQIIYTGIGEV